MSRCFSLSLVQYSTVVTSLESNGLEACVGLHVFIFSDVSHYESLSFVYSSLMRGRHYWTTSVLKFCVELMQSEAQANSSRAYHCRDKGSGGSSGGITASS